VRRRISIFAAAAILKTEDQEAVMAREQDRVQTALMMLGGAFVGFSVAVILKLMLDALGV
jgi:hypothetical protein